MVIPNDRLVIMRSNTEVTCSAPIGSEFNRELSSTVHRKTTTILQE